MEGCYTCHITTCNPLVKPSVRLYDFWEHRIKAIPMCRKSVFIVGIVCFCTFEVYIELRGDEKQRRNAVCVSQHLGTFFRCCPNIVFNPIVDCITNCCLCLLVVMMTKQDTTDFQRTGVFIKQVCDFSSTQHFRQYSMNISLFKLFTRACTREVQKINFLQELSFASQ